jgi:hypothetical protein
VKTKRDYVKLNTASATIFERGEETYLKEQVLKRKFDALKKEFTTIQNELKDKTKKFDVKYNIEKLRHTNKYYKELCEDEESLTMLSEQAAPSSVSRNAADDFAPIKLTKEQEENMRSTANEAISLQGQFDTEAFYEKFENSKEKREQKAEAEKKEIEQKEQEEKAQREQEEKEQKEAEAKKAQENDKEVMDSIDQIRNILGSSIENDKAQEK